MMSLLLKVVINLMVFSMLSIMKENKILLSQLPILNKINFGGEPLRLIISSKSVSFEIIITVLSFA
jgi:hypothetical protein